VLVISGDDRHGAPGDLFDAGDGISSVAHDVAEAEYRVGARVGCVREDGGERFEIAVDVGQNRVSD